MTNISLADLMRPLITKRSVFVSYHHGRDASFYGRLALGFSRTYNLVRDQSVRSLLDSEDPEYVIRGIRERYLTGTSCTLVLCGPETYKRKFVDWEIKATLDKNHGLVGVNLPTNTLTVDGKYVVPSRLHDNIQSGYAIWTEWQTFTSSVEKMKELIELGIARPTSLIKNDRALMGRNCP